MDKQKLETEYVSNDDQSKTLFENIWNIIRTNWLAILFASIIALITIIVVPIIYSLRTAKPENNLHDLHWNVTGITVINQSTLLNDNLNNSFGLISAIKYDIDSDSLFILDRTLNRLTKYSFVDNQLTLLLGYLNGTYGSNQNSLYSPNDIYLQSTDQIYIADTLNNRIQYLDGLNNPTTTIYGQDQATSADHQLNSPMSLTMDQNSNLYIADYGNNRIVCYNIDTKTFNITIPYNYYQERNTFVYTPISIKYDSNPNSLVIAQEQGFNVVRWNLTGNTWNLVAGSASSDLNGTSRTLFNKLCSIEIIPTLETTFVADCNNQRIQFYQGDLTKGRTIAGVIQASGNNQYIFNYPTSITLDAQYNLYVADAKNFRIQKFLQI